MKNILSFVFGLFVFSAMPLKAAEDLPKTSIYNLKAVWKNTQGQEVSLKKFQGQKVLIAMVYTKCPHACPMMVAKLTGIAKEIRKKTKEDFKIVIASFDHKRDTPDHLAKYAESKRLDESRWKFLSPPDEATARTLAVVLGISFKELDDGEFSHSNVITLLNDKGVVISKLDNLSSDISPLIQAF